MTMNGIDVSSWQSGIDLSLVPCDFVICKATGGVGYVNPDCDCAYQQAKALGKKLGVYHFAREAGCEGSAEAEARFFVDNVQGYVGEAILVLDWEASAVEFGVGWAKAWLDEVQRLTGVKPLLYSYNNCVNSYDRSSVANADYGLWNAGYYAYGTPMGYNPDAPLIGGTGAWSGAAMYQYTSEGRLDGWNGNLDLNVFYGDGAAWDAYAGAKPKARPISEAGFQPIPAQAYTGKELYPELVPSDATATYWTSYRNNVDIGWGAAIATGHDGWEGTAEVRFKILPQCLVSYDDIEPTAWYVDAVRHAVERNVMSGYDHSTFGPDDALSRAQAVCVVYKAADMVDDPLPYTDVEQAPWYHAALEWATAQGIACGDEGMFRPSDACTREEFATMLHRWQGCPEAALCQECSEWAAQAVGWAVEAGVMGDGGVRATDACARAEAAAMVTRVK